MKAKTFAICIVSHNREIDLIYTIEKLREIDRFDECTLYVFMDGYFEEIDHLKEKWPTIKWFESKTNIGASKARKLVYEQISETYIIGFDDDSHSLNLNLFNIVENTFNNDHNIGVIAFSEIKGLYSEEELTQKINQISIQVPKKSNEFIGCGYAIRRDLYNLTNGFPSFINIYGEESFVSFEIMKLGYDILHLPELIVHHRVNRQIREKEGYNTFRYNKQLAHSIVFYYCYYPYPIMMWKILKLAYHNFKKYALRDFNYFFNFFKGVLKAIYIIMITKDLKNTSSNYIIQKYESTNGARLTY